MPNCNSIVNLPGLKVIKIHQGNPLIIEAKSLRKIVCIYCNNNKLRKKARFIRSVHHEAFAKRRVLLKLQAHKFYCPSCNKYFNQRFAGILPRHRSSQKLKEYAFWMHTQGVSQKDLQRHLKVGKSTIERWFHEGYYRENKKIADRLCPTILGIDEHTFNKKSGYATTFCDLRNNRVFDIVQGKSHQGLKNYLNDLQGKERVKVICIDLSSTYRHIIKRYFPNAKIVADRFHVIRLIQHMCLKTYHHIDPNIKYHRGILAVLRTRPDRLKEKRKKVKQLYLQQNPAIAHIDSFKQQLHQLLMIKKQNAKACEKLIPTLLNMIEQLKQSPFEYLQKLGKTLDKWQQELVRMWRFTKNNGITEGFHRKMKLIQRRAYGFKNFDNYRMRVRILCA